MSSFFGTKPPLQCYTGGLRMRVGMRKRVVIVEDDEVVADHLAALVREQLKCIPVVSTTAGEALSRLDRIDFGFLDIKVNEGVTFPVATRPCEQGVPFAFMSATDPGLVPADLAQAPFLRRPVAAPRLLDVARRHL